MTVNWISTYINKCTWVLTRIKILKVITKGKQSYNLHVCRKICQDLMFSSVLGTEYCQQVSSLWVQNWMLLQQLSLHKCMISQAQHKENQVRCNGLWYKQKPIIHEIMISPDVVNQLYIKIQLHLEQMTRWTLK